jgi:hypothetical protein
VSFSKIFDVEIVGSLLGSNDHCYVMMNVADHFESRVSYVHTSNHILRIKFLKSTSSSLFISGGGRIIRPKTGSSDSLFCYPLSTVGSSDPNLAPSSGLSLLRTGSSGHPPDDPASPLCQPSDHPALHRMIRPWRFTYIKN